MRVEIDCCSTYNLLPIYGNVTGAVCLRGQSKAHDSVAPFRFRLIEDECLGADLEGLLHATGRGNLKEVTEKIFG